VEVRNLRTSQTCQGRSIDLSRSGISFFAERFIPKGTTISIGVELTVAGRPALVRLNAVVIWAQLEGNGGIMGAQFVTELSPTVQPVLCEVIDSRS